MFSKSEETQYSRQLMLSGFGAEKQQRLKAAKVLMVGAGGLGCPALLYLAAAGVGIIGIIDGDAVDLTNLHRQVLFTHDDLGQNKAEAAAKRLSANNPHVSFDIYPERLSNDNALEVLADYDVIVDGTDNFQTRYLINDACVILDKPFVYGAIMKFEGQVCVFNHRGGPTYRCLFPEPPAPGSVPGCGEVGVIGVLPGIIGTYQAMEAIKIIAGIGKVRSGELLMLNTLDNTHMSIIITANPANQQIDELTDYEAFCGLSDSSVPTITADELKNQIKTVHILDVREPAEIKAYNLGGTFIPLDQLDVKWQSLPPDEEIIVVCQSGKRSARAVKVLQEKGLTQVRSLDGGLNGYQQSRL